MTPSALRNHEPGFKHPFKLQITSTRTRELTGSIIGIHHQPIGRIQAHNTTLLITNNLGTLNQIRLRRVLTRVRAHQTRLTIKFPARENVAQLGTDQPAHRIVGILRRWALMVSILSRARYTHHATSTIVGNRSLAVRGHHARTVTVGIVPQRECVRARVRESIQRLNLRIYIRRARGRTRSIGHHART